MSALTVVGLRKIYGDLAALEGVDLHVARGEIHAIVGLNGAGVTYVLGDASDGGVLDGASFDVVVCNFGLSDIDDLEGVCDTIVRVLRPAGRFVFSILHPCFAGADGVSGSWPTDGCYYDERWWRAEAELSTLRREVGANHRTMSTYVNAFAARGLWMEAMREPRPETSWTFERPAAADQPVYLVARLRRQLDLTMLEYETP